MPKLTPSENKLLELIANAGGTYCPGADVKGSSELHRIVRRLERKGLLLVEQTDDGFRYSLVEALHG
jgi:DNA-binding MarR family transcriptional regulator